MSSIWFILKSLVLTVLVLIVLQIKFGQQSLEDRLISSARSAGVVDFAQDMADGAIKFFRNTWNKVGGDGRTEIFDLNRSKEYLKQQSKDK